MTKIDQIAPQPAQPQTTPRPGQVSGGGDFARLLSEALERPGEASASQPLSAPSGVSPVSSVTGVEPVSAVEAPAGLTPAQSQAWDQAQSLVDSLEGYQRLLEDRQATLKQVEPALQAAEASARRLAESAQALEDGDELRGLAQEALALVAQESMRFGRGDYQA